jgi:hypothetical protein
MNPKLMMRFAIGMFFFVPVTSFTLSAQSKKVNFNTSTVVPGAEGKVKVKKDKNGNFNVAIDVVNLAPPGKLTPAKKVYVVWLETAEKGVKNIGQINSSGSLFSKTRKGSINTVSPHKPVRIFISAEDDPAIEEPGTLIVLTTESFWGS